MSFKVFTWRHYQIERLTHVDFDRLRFRQLLTHSLLKQHQIRQLPALKSKNTTTSLKSRGEIKIVISKSRFT